MKELHLKYYTLIPLSVLLMTALLQPQMLFGQAAMDAEIAGTAGGQRYPAILEAVDRVALHAQVSGYLEAIEFTEGSFVSRGDLLFRIDQRVFEAQFADADAALAVAKAEAELAHNESGRAQRLFNRNAISAEEAERRKAQAIIADARLQTAEANLRKASLDLQFTEIRAPFDGRIGRAQITPGNLVTTADTLAVIVAMDQLYARLDVAEHEFTALGSSPESQWLVRFSNDRTGDTVYRSTGIIIDNEVRKGTGSVRIYALIDNSGHHLLPGMFGLAELRTGSSGDAVPVISKSLSSN